MTDQYIPIRGLRGGMDTLDNHCRMKLWAIVEEMVSDALNANSLTDTPSLAISDVIVDCLKNITEEAALKVPLYVDAVRLSRTIE